MPKNKYTARIERLENGEFKLSLNPALAEMLNLTIEPHLSVGCPIFATLAEEALRNEDVLKKGLKGLAKASDVDLPKDYFTFSIPYLQETASHVSDRVKTDSDPESSDINLILDAVQAAGFLDDVRGVYFAIRPNIRAMLADLVNAEPFIEEDLVSIARASMNEQILNSMMQRVEERPN